MSIRAAARVAGVPAATVQGWLNGRYFPTPALQGEFARLATALGLDDWLTSSLWIGVEPHAMERRRAPYLGFAPYSVSDADLFFGRDAETERLASAVNSARGTSAPVVVVVGGSGSGKSSLLRAGLVGHACAESGPLREWSPRFLSLDELPGAVAITQLDPELWLVDQIEDGLEEIAEQPFACLENVPSGVVVVLAVRSDALARLAEIPQLTEPISRLFVMRPMTTSDAREAIRRPCELLGATVEEGLVELVLRDVGISSDRLTLSRGVLPLLSNTLMVTWASRSTNSVMSSASYLANGGLAGSLNTLAEKVYARLPEGDAHLVQAAFLTLVQVEKLAVRRRSVDLSDLTQEQMLLLRPFVDERLVSVSDVPRVQISHDALLTSWGRLIDWISEDRDRLRTLNVVRHATQAWSDNERSDELLIPVNSVPGLREVIAGTWTDAPLTESEREFLRASTQHFAMRLQIEQRRDRRLRRQRYVNWAMLVFAVAVVVALVLITIYL